MTLDVLQPLKQVDNFNRLVTRLTGRGYLGLALASAVFDDERL